ncbi:MAG: DUF2236 domain-containing protein [Archangiaceae bacterium]|nr:DUF2236 domain-containing protein [Archangiaceae bacterium]
MPVLLDKVSFAIAEAQALLWSRQREDGSWNVAADMGPACTAQVTVALAYAGVLTDEERGAVTRWLRAQQREDGSFLPYPYARAGGLSATACAWAAFTVCGVGVNDPALQRARAYVEANGGLAALRKQLMGGELAPLYLCLAGLAPADVLPRLPLGWTGVKPLTDALAKVVHGGATFAAAQLSVIGRALRGEKPGDFSTLSGWIDTWQNRDGSINANALQTAVTLVTLKAMGERAGSRRFDLAVGSLRSMAQRDAHGTWFAAFESDVWTTALDVRALLESGVPARDGRLVRAVEYLLRCQSRQPQPRANNRFSDAVRTGGWAFQRDNLTMVDNDDTGMVLSVLGHWLQADGEDDALHRSVGHAVAKGRAFVQSMQNEDGGFSAFVRGLPRRRLGPMMSQPVSRPESLAGWWRWVTHPPESLGDPSTEDVTARVLLGLAQTGSEARDPRVASALAFLRRLQQPSGAFWGRWVVNYLPSTAYVLMACAGLGLGRETPWVDRAASWLLGLQNPDGGWGEWIDSYVDPSRAGRAPSSAPLTGLVLAALLDLGVTGEAIDRAAQYLVAQQQPHGGWPNTDYLAVFVPPDAFYEYPGTNDYAPLLALSRYQRSRRAASLPRPAHPLEPQLGALSQRGDPAADAAAAALDRDGQWPALFKALAFGRPVDGFAEPVRALVEQGTTLPAGIDPARLRAGQEVFARHSWAMGNAFFFCSIPSSYAGPKGARVLMRSGSLKSDARRRLLDTGHFMWAVMTPGAFEAGGRGFTEVARVRLVHARIRRALAQGGWPASDGDPIDQASMIGTIMVLSWAAISGLERLGVSLAPHQADDLMHAWRAVGELMGIERGLLPDTFEEGGRTAKVLERQMMAPSGEGTELARELVNVVSDYLPHDALADWPVDMIRHTAGDAVADLLGLPRGGGTRGLIANTCGLWRHTERLPLSGLQHRFTANLIAAQRLPMVLQRALKA